MKRTKKTHSEQQFSGPHKVLTRVGFKPWKLSAVENGVATALTISLSVHLCMFVCKVSRSSFFQDQPNMTALLVSAIPKAQWHWSITVDRHNVGHHAAVHCLHSPYSEGYRKYTPTNVNTRHELSWSEKDKFKVLDWFIIWTQILLISDTVRGPDNRW